MQTVHILNILCLIFFLLALLLKTYANNLCCFRNFLKNCQSKNALPRGKNFDYIYKNALFNLTQMCRIDSLNAVSI